MRAENNRMVRKRSPLLLGFLLIVGFSAGPTSAQDPTAKEGKKKEAVRQEEERDYYESWLKRDVVYVITEEEKSVFNSLSTPEEKEQFIEQFWLRRDPDPSTPGNEFKEEHYRRIAYANEKFQSGFPGWMTDRGRVYIIHGPPDEIISRPTGGHQQRPLWEGGGSTTTYPHEVWWYRNIQGLGDVELEFVDKSLTGRYELAIAPQEKDALLNVAGLGPTLAEMMGAATKADRPYLSGDRQYPLMYQRAQDNPFQRYESIARMQAPQPIKFKDLQEIVKVDIRYEDLPFRLQEDFFRLNDAQLLVPITLQVNNKDLTFERRGEVHVARVAAYGIVTTITGRIITEFDDQMIVSSQPENFPVVRQQKSVYQKMLVLDEKMPHRIDFVVKDQNSGKVGVARKAVLPPAFDKEELTASSMILSDSMTPLREIPGSDRMFVLGDVSVLPRLDKTFRTQSPLGIYLQVYNSGFDQASQSPSLRVTCRLLKDGRAVRERVDENGDTVHYSSSQRVVLMAEFTLDELEDGEYRIQVEVEDLIKGQSVSLEEPVRLLESQTKPPG